jgi:thiamine-phosphate diphosphorylase
VILYLVTDRRRLAAGAPPADARRCLLQQAAQAVSAGIDGIILRERDLEARALTDLARELVTLSRGSRTRVIVSDRADVALAAGADGVHLRGDSFAAGEVRRLMPRPCVIGRSVHGVGEAMAAGDVDYLIAGTVWQSESKPGADPLLGIDGFSVVARSVRVPVLAIGGVTIERVPVIADAGGAGVAAIGLFMDPASSRCRATALQTIAQEARARFDTSGSRS